MMAVGGLSIEDASRTRAFGAPLVVPATLILIAIEEGLHLNRFHNL